MKDGVVFFVAVTLALLLSLTYGYSKGYDDGVNTKIKIVKEINRKGVRK